MNIKIEGVNDQDTVVEDDFSDILNIDAMNLKTIPKLIPIRPADIYNSVSSAAIFKAKSDFTLTKEILDKINDAKERSLSQGS